MSLGKPIQRIAIVGTGVIGASWAALYLARGFSVVATNRTPSAEAGLRQYIEAVWPEFTVLGLSPRASLDRLQFTVDMKQALRRLTSCRKTGLNARTSRSNCSLRWTLRLLRIQSLRPVHPG